MGKRGPAKKPTNLAILHGDRSDRINHDAPVPSDDALLPPEDMSDDALAIWDYTIKQLGAMKIATAADRDALAVYCEAVVTHRKTTRLIAQSGILVRTAKGNIPMRNPLIAVQRDAATLIRIYAREFGLTPSARSDIGAGGGSNSGTGAERLLS